MFRKGFGLGLGLFGAFIAVRFLRVLFIVIGVIVAMVLVHGMYR